jgi:hypothetical protein
MDSVINTKTFVRLKDRLATFTGSLTEPLARQEYGISEAALPYVLRKMKQLEQQLPQSPSSPEEVCQLVTGAVVSVQRALADRTDGGGVVRPIFYGVLDELVALARAL